MPTKLRRENTLIRLFLSAYEDRAWANAKLDWLDEQQNGAVEVLATRQADLRTLAIEHTLIEFFIGERTDRERFKPFLPIENDPALVVPGKILYVDVPRGVVDGMNRQQQDHVVSAVRTWLRAAVHSLPIGESRQPCDVPANGGMPASTVLLAVRVINDPRGGGMNPIIRRYGDVDVGESVENALATKTPKLARTPADARLLMLERDQWKLHPLEVHNEVEKRRPRFPALAAIDVWIVETIGAKADLSGYIEFARYEGEEVVEHIAFENGKLFSRSRNGMPLPEV